MGRVAVPDGFKIRNLSPPSASASAAAVTLKVPVPVAEPAGMVTVKSGTGVKSASWAEPAATDTKTSVAVAGRGGWPSPPKPINSAVTRTVLSDPSRMLEALTSRVMWASSSKMVASDPITNAPSAVPETTRVSGPSKSVSAAAVMFTGPEARLWPAGIFTSKSCMDVKSVVCAEPAAADTVTNASCAGRDGCPGPP